MSTLVTRVADLGQDVLLVEGLRDGTVLTARGWVSATQQHYDADAYDELGNRSPDAQSRPMTDAEALDYARALLDEQNPVQVDPPAEVRDLGLADPGAADALAAAEAGA